MVATFLSQNSPSPMLLSACTDRVSGKVHPDRRLSIAQRLHRRERCRLAASHVRPPRSCSKYPFHDPAHKGGDDLLSFQTLPADHQGITDRPQFAAAKGGVLDRRRNACRRKGRLGEPTAASSGPSLKPPALPGDTYRIIFWKNGSGSPGWTPQLYSPVTNTKPSASRFAGRPVEAGR